MKQNGLNIGKTNIINKNKPSILIKSRLKEIERKLIELGYCK